MSANGEAGEGRCFGRCVVRGNAYVSTSSGHVFLRVRLSDKKCGATLIKIDTHVLTSIQDGESVS